MSQSQVASRTGLYGDSSAAGLHRIDGEERVQELLHVLNDADCRNILEATSDETLSAKEIADACSLPMSTTYRKLDLLANTELLAERIRIHHAGNHASEYSRVVEEIVMSIGANGEIHLEVSQCESNDAAKPSGIVGGGE